MSLAITSRKPPYAFKIYSLSSNHDMLNLHSFEINVDD